MKERKREGEKSRSRFADAVDGSSHPAIGCGNQYSTSVTALQGEVGEKFAPKKKRALILADMYRELGDMSADTLLYKDKEQDPFARRFYNRADRVFTCGSFLEFHVMEHEAHLCNANFCRDRFCPMCTWRRSLKIFGQVSQVMNVLESQKYRFLFLTLTVKNCSGEDFPKTVQLIYDGWRELYHHYFQRRKALKGVVCGTFRSLEVTINHKTGEFHPHLHVILAVLPEYFTGRAYIKQEQWADMWRVACGLDYKPIVDIRTVKPKRDEKTGEMSMASAVAEVSKYAAKDKDYLTDPEKELDGQLDLVGHDCTYYLRILMQGLTGRRLVGLTGCFKAVKQALGLDDLENGDLVHVDGDELREDVVCLIVRYQWRNGVYVESIQAPTMEEKMKALGPIEPTEEEMRRMEQAAEEAKRKRDEQERKLKEQRAKQFIGPVDGRAVII